MGACGSPSSSSPARCGQKTRTKNGSTKSCDGLRWARPLLRVNSNLPHPNNGQQPLPTRPLDQPNKVFCRRAACKRPRQGALLLSSPAAQPAEVAALVPAAQPPEE